MTNDKRVGWIGLGDLGGAMAKRIQTQGVPLTVFDIDRAAVDRLAAVGARPAASVAELGASCDLVLLSLPHPIVLEEVALGRNGLIGAMAAGSLVCDTSTNGPAAVMKVRDGLSAKGIRMVEAAIGKGPPAAERGDLTIMMGGEPALLDEVRFVFKLIGSKLVRCGPFGAGQAIKVANNIASCANIAVAAEAYAVVVKAGVDPEVFAEILPTTAADSWQLRNTLIDKVLHRRDLSPVFKLKLARKDLQLAVALADQLGLPSSCAKGALDWYDEGSARGHDDLDQSAIILWTNPELAGV